MTTKKSLDEFEKEWESQQGALMLKEKHPELEWRKTVAWHFWQAKDKIAKAENEKLKKQNEILRERER